MSSHRIVVKALLPIGILCTVFACSSDPAPGTSVDASLAAARQQQCQMTAKFQCPFACAKIDLATVCHADLGGGFDTHCEAAATGNCLATCGADCTSQCSA